MNTSFFSKANIIIVCLILPIFGLVSLILDAKSIFESLNSFIDRPTYVYGSEPSYLEDNHVYVLSLKDCKTHFSDDLVKFVNNLDKDDYSFICNITFLFSLSSLIINHTLKVWRMYLVVVLNL